MRIYDTDKYKSTLLNLNPNIKVVGEFKTVKDKILHKCNICNGEWYATPANILKGKGCPYCAGKKVLLGFNDLWTTNPNIASWLKDEELGYKITKGSNKKVTFVCPCCGKEKISSPNKIAKKFVCDYCSDGISYPEKFILSFLNQLYIDFIYQYSKVNDCWCGKYKYDFYFEYNGRKIIIEANGIQHYEKSFNTVGGRTISEEIENDKNKELLALQNGIDNYIVLDCKFSQMEYIQNSIKNSLLSEFFDLSKVDFLKCNKDACDTIVFKVCEEYNKNNDVLSIAQNFHISQSAVYSYLRRGDLLNLCEYKGIENTKEALSTPVVCLNNKKVYDSMIEASRQTKVSQQSIKESCSQHKILASKNPCNMWAYQSEYNNNSYIENEYSETSKNKKRIICLNTNTIFNSISDAKKWCGKSDINSALSHRQATAGRHPLTGEKLLWAYCEDDVNG